MSDTLRIVHVDPKDDSSLQEIPNTSQNVEIMRVRDTSEALALLTEDIDCFVSVSELPDSDGLTLFERVRERDSEVAFVLAPGTWNDSLANRAINHGVDAYLPTDVYRVETVAERVMSLAETRFQHRTSEDAEQPPTEYQKLLEAISTTYPDSIYVYNEAGEYLEVLIGNQRTELTNRESLLGQRVDDVLSDEMAERFHASIDAALETGELQLLEYSIASDERTYWFEGALGKISGGYLGEDAVLCSVRDITERKTAIRELRERKLQLALLNQMFQHDLRNDMLVLLNYARELKSHVDDSGSDYLDTVLDRGERITDMTEYVEKIIKTIEDDGTQELVPVELLPLLRREFEEVSQMYPNADFRSEEKWPDVVVQANGMLESVLRNLLTNAVKHNDKADPEVIVSVAVDDETVRVQVTDNGPGVPDGQKEEIFGKGEQGPASGGSGLGLYLVYTVVTQYGGDVWVEDNEPDGSVFILELPQASG